MLVIFVALLSTVSAAKYCCSPEQWHGQVGLVMGTITNGSTAFIEGMMNMTYDGTNKIVAYDQFITITTEHGNSQVGQRVVNDHKNNVMYVINSEGCQTMPAAPWISGCVPDNAVETSNNSIYGLGDNSIHVKGYFAQMPGYEMYLAVTADTCVPVAEVFTGSLEAITGQNYGTTETMETLTFANIKPGIPTASGPFYVPAQCRSAQVGQPVGRRALVIL